MGASHSSVTVILSRLALGIDFDWKLRGLDTGPDLARTGDLAPTRFRELRGLHADVQNLRLTLQPKLRLVFYLVIWNLH